MEALLLAAQLNQLLVIFMSILLQSLPFVLVGVFASALAQHALTDRVIARWMPRRTLPTVVLASVSGMLVPVCDCGAIPLARRLAAKGLPTYAAVTFLLAAPVVNPIVLSASALAFQGNVGVVVLRLTMTLSVAIAVGLVMSAVFPSERLKAPGPHIDAAASPTGLVRHASAELFDILFFIVLGAACTAATQTFVPRADLAAFGGQRVASVMALMPLATILSICSEADAFVARAFANTFSPGAVLAFMTIGQILDLRNGLLLIRTVGLRVVALIAGIGYALVLVEAVALNGLVAGP